MLQGAKDQGCHVIMLWITGGADKCVAVSKAMEPLARLHGDMVFAQADPSASKANKALADGLGIKSSSMLHCYFDFHLVKRIENPDLSKLDELVEKGVTLTLGVLVNDCFVLNNYTNWFYRSIVHYGWPLSIIEHFTNLPTPKIISADCLSQPEFI